MNEAVLKGQVKSEPYIRPDAADFLAWNNARPESQTGGDMAPQAMCQWPLILTHFWPIELTHLLTANRRFSASNDSSHLPA